MCDSRQVRSPPSSFLNSIRDVSHVSLKIPPALFYDCTHDNETPNEKRHPSDRFVLAQCGYLLYSLPNAALVSMTACAIGSTRGYDELFPERVDLVKEERVYKCFESENVGMMAARKVLNELHT